MTLKIRPKLGRRKKKKIRPKFSKEHPHKFLNLILWCQHYSAVKTSWKLWEIKNHRSCSPWKWLIIFSTNLTNSTLWNLCNGCMVSCNRNASYYSLLISHDAEITSNFCFSVLKEISFRMSLRKDALVLSSHRDLGTPICTFFLFVNVDSGSKMKWLIKSIFYKCEI